MTNKTIVITGANRGIGLSLCKHYKGKDYTVYAVFRHTSTELENLGVEFIEGIDVRQRKRYSPALYNVCMTSNVSTMDSDCESYLI